MPALLTHADPTARHCVQYISMLAEKVRDIRRTGPKSSGKAGNFDYAAIVAFDPRALRGLVVECWCGAGAEFRALR